MATEIAKAYVQIIPSARGISSGIEEALDGEMRTSSKKSASTFSTGFLTAAATTIAAGSAAVGAAVLATVKESVQSYSEYEQLVGGSKLMFGDAYEYIEDKAADAWKSVQLSQSDYLEQVNGFAVGLRTALEGDEQAAASLANRIVEAEADIVAATGNSQEAVQNAFNGVMKGNYTMLDNLGLGINATKEGMQSVIDATNKWNAENGKATSYVIDNLADCQNALVDYVEMQGMAGYASAEAFDTIQGSLSATQSAWSNLITGLADDNADLDSLISNFSDSLIVTLNNIIPRAESSLSGLGKVVQNIAPILSAELPGLIEEVLPEFLSAASDLVDGIISATPTFVSVLSEQIPKIVISLINTLLSLAPMLLQSGIDAVNSISGGIESALPELIPAATDVVLQLVTTILQNLPDIINVAISLIVAICEGINEAIPILIESLPAIIEAIIETLITLAPQLLSVGIQLMNQIGIGIWRAAISLTEQTPAILAGVVASIANSFVNIKDIGINAVKGLWSGISSQTEWIINKVKGFADNVLKSIKNVWQIHSPSRVFSDEVGKFIPAGIAVGIEENSDEVGNAIEKISDEVVHPFDMSALNFESNVSKNYRIYEERDDRNDEISQILAVLSRYLPMLLNKDITLDTGAIVGQIAPAMDSELGRLAALAQRGV